MRLRPYSVQTFVAIVAMAVAFSIAAQPPPPPPPGPHPPPGPEDSRQVEARLKDIERRAALESFSDGQTRELAGYVKQYAKQARDALDKGNTFAAARFADAADDCRRPIDHLRHIVGDSGEPHPPPGPAVASRMRQLYFRLRLAEYFLRQIPDPKPERLLVLARAFYQDSLKATQAKAYAKADEYEKSTDDLTHALEHLAQAYAPAPPGPPPPPPEPRR